MVEMLQAERTSEYQAIGEESFLWEGLIGKAELRNLLDDLFEQPEEREGQWA